MLYDVRHRTRFTYPKPVRFARCNLRLKPIDWPGQRLVDFDLAVAPGGHLSPARADASLANVTRLVVEQPVDHLTIESSFRVAVDRLVPAPAPDDPNLRTVARLARESRDVSAQSPANYLFPTDLIPFDSDIALWCAESLAPERPALEAGIDLARRIQREFAFDPHATVTETPPARAFAQRGGVCQDFAQVMIAGLRAAGLPAAYASGYLRTIPPPGEPRLVGADATHAWVLLWCGPEREWIGLDPTNGIWMAGDHIVAAVGRDYAEIAPVDGIFLGSGAHRMEVAVDVEPVDEALDREPRLPIY